MDLKNIIRETFNKIIEEEKYYSSHGEVMPFSEFVEIEVNERGNYTQEDIVKWKNKYKLTDDSTVIWISPYKWMAHRYNLPAGKWDENKLKSMNDDEFDVETFDSSEGFIIPESDDGEHGYLFVFNQNINEIISERKHKRKKHRKNKLRFPSGMAFAYAPGIFTRTFSGWNTLGDSGDSGDGGDSGGDGGGG